jgi:predicted DCC family thiol-disulfide oxidoreductase YuxK
MNDFPNENRTIVFIDGYCNLCNGLVRFLIKVDKNEKLFFTSLNSPFSQTLLYSKNIDLKNPKSVYLLKNNFLYDKSMAIIEILNSLGFPFKVFKIFKIFPPQVRDIVYDFIASNRYKIFGKSQECQLSDNKTLPRIL